MVRIRGVLSGVYAGVIFVFPLLLSTKRYQQDIAHLGNLFNFKEPPVKKTKRIPRCPMVPPCQDAGGSSFVAGTPLFVEFGAQ